MLVNRLAPETNSYLVQGTKFEVDKRYQIIEPMSLGAYGIACSALDSEMDEKVAVKKIEDFPEHITITKRTLRELRILRHLQHENLMQVKSIFVTGTKHMFEEIYVVSELMDTDLAALLRSSQVLSDDHCQFLLYQICRGMKYVHSAQVIHRNLKPQSLLVNNSCDLKICDFSLARVRFSDQDWVYPMTEYVCTPWYKAPEVLCSWVDDSCAIDIWSIGCILAEMQSWAALFPARNTQHHLGLILDILGSPDSEELLRIPNEKCRKFISQLPKRPAKDFSAVAALAKVSQPARELLKVMLRWDPQSRATVAEVIQHPYLEELHCPEDEPTRAPLDALGFEFERGDVTPTALREEIFHEALSFYPSVL